MSSPRSPQRPDGLEALSAAVRQVAEASLFASALLMPADEFRAAYTEVDGDAWKLAVRFDVSPRAAGVRAQALQLS